MSNVRTSKSSRVNLALFLVLALLWSGSFINIKIVVDQLPPIFCAMMRVLVSLCTLSLLFLIMRKKVFSLPLGCWKIWIAGLFAQSLPFLFLFIGEKYIAPGLASIINSTVTIWALILGTIIFRDFSQWTLLKIIGIIVGFIGIVLIFQPFIHGHENSLLGIISVTTMAVAYAIGGLINQHVIFKKMQVKFETNLLQQHIASLIFLFICSLSLETWPSWISVVDSKLTLAFLYLGVMATAIAFMIYFYLIREWGAVRAASVMYLVPVLAVTWDAVFLKIIPSSQEILGMVAILGGVSLIQWMRRPSGVNLCSSRISGDIPVKVR